MEKDPLGFGGYADTEDPLKCGYTIQPSVPYPSMDRGDVANNSGTDYPASANMDGYRDDQENEAAESRATENEEHE